MKRIRKTSTLILCVALLISLFTPIACALGDTTKYADALHELGLFQGTESGYELERQPTRVEGIVMFVRLIGAEKYVIASEYTHPFFDVPTWASSYVGYAYANGLTNGVSENSFGSQAPLSLQQYITFILRALGYNETAGDFSWNTVIDKAKEINLLGTEQVSDTEEITRGTVVELSWKALTQCQKNSSYTLANSLVENGVFTKEQAVQYGIWSEPDPFDTGLTTISSYSDVIRAGRKDINTALSAQPIDEFFLKYSYKYLLNLYMHEYSYKALVYGYYTGDYSSNKFDSLIERIDALTDEMKQHIDSSEVDFLRTDYAIASYYAYQTDAFAAGQNLIGSKESPDVDAMWNAYVMNLVNSGIGLWFGEPHPEG